MKRATNYSMDLSEVGIGDPTPHLNYDMCCPEVGLSGGYNWSREQCILRVRLNNPCTVKCTHGREIRAELEATGEDWQLEPFPGVAVGKKAAKRVTPPKDPNRMWPGKHKERNIRISVDIASGLSVGSVSEKYGMSPTNIRRITNSYFCIANPKVFKACPGNVTRIEFVRTNKAFFLPFLKYHDSPQPEFLRGD